MQSSSAISAISRPCRSRSVLRSAPTEFILKYLYHIQNQCAGGTTISLRKAPQISVIVVNWNRRPLLEACLKSLAAQQHTSFDVVVVDNGSTDGSIELVRKLYDTFPVELHLIENALN